MKKKQVRILYIEDDPGSRMLVRRILNQPPFLYSDASTGLEGLKKALRDKPDLILMDINLPDISGTELTTKIKNTDTLKDIVVVALTGATNEHAREMTLIAGCDGFMSKPIDVKKFPSQLLQFIRGKREALELDSRDFFHSRYEKSLVEHLTGKVEELQKFNVKLSRTSSRLKDYSAYLEKVLTILSQLQLCTSPQHLKENLINQITDNFRYERCVFLDVNTESQAMQINYARGVERNDWPQFTIPFNNTLFRQLFQTESVLYVPRLSLVNDEELRRRLKEFGTRQFVFGYIGTPMKTQKAEDIRERVLPMLESFMPKLHDQVDTDVDRILDHLEEYFASESLYRGGFVFLDNCYSHRKIHPYEYRFLESLFRTTSYMYQNLLLMEELRLLFIRAEKEAITDPLTNLHNYRYFMHQLNREISRNRRHGSRFSLIMIDIDFFKKYNDDFGHQAGDLILRRLARLMMENTRSSDIVARYGGEEFMIICPELEKPGAIQMAEKLRQIVEQYRFTGTHAQMDRILTISLGVATFPEDGDTAFSLIRNVDNALYAAKNEGRNRVCS